MRDTMTPAAFERKLRAVQGQLQELAPVIARTPEGPAREGLLARQASLVRTARWYVRRLPLLKRKQAARQKAELTGRPVPPIGFEDVPADL